MLTKAVDIYSNHPQILISMLHGRHIDGEIVKVSGIEVFKKGNLITVDASPRFGNNVYAQLKRGGVTYLKEIIADLQRHFGFKKSGLILDNLTLIYFLSKPADLLRFTKQMSAQSPSIMPFIACVDFSLI